MVTHKSPSATILFVGGCYKNLEFALLPTAPQRRITPSSASHQGKTVDANARASNNASANTFKSLLLSLTTTMTTSSSTQSACIPVSLRLEPTGRHRFYVRVHTLQHHALSSLIPSVHLGHVYHPWHPASGSPVAIVHPGRVHPPVHRA